LDFPRSARNIRYKIAASFPQARFLHRARQHYEVLRLKWQAPDVLCTLPHDSAIVSKTRSCRIIGFT
jgi:hypothetical protein